MNSSVTIKELAEALSKFQGEMEAVKKNAENTFYKSKFADLASIIEASKPKLSANGLAIAQFLNGSGLRTILMHKSGEWIEDTYTLIPVDNKPQSFGSAISFARRYALCAILGIATEDDDGQAASTLSQAKVQTEKTIDALREAFPDKEVADDFPMDDMPQVRKCPKHLVELKPSKLVGGTPWCATKEADGTWCKAYKTMFNK